LPSSESSVERVELLRQHGVVHTPNVLSKHSAQSLREYALKCRDLASNEVVNGDAEEFERFSDVLSPNSVLEQVQRRWDLKLPLEAPVKLAVAELLAPGSPLRQVLDEVVGPSSTLQELGCLISAPGSSQQVCHSDTMWTPEPVLFTTFITLQDVSRDLGPTVFLPGTHSEEAHVRFDDVEEKDSLLQETGQCRGVLECAQAITYDSRLLHCGSPNEADTRDGMERAIFYLSFSTGEELKEFQNVATIRPEIQSRFTLLSLSQACTT